MCASEWCILITHVLTKAWEKVCEDTGDIWDYFKQNGCLVAETDKEDDKICP